MKVEPHKYHAWLNNFLGEWNSEAEAMMGPDQPPSLWKGTESVRSLGGLWILCEGRGEMPGGGDMKSIITIGYDPAKGKFVGSFVSSAMPSLWIYEGSLDAEGKMLTLDADGPSFTDPTKTSKYQDIFEIVSENERALYSQVLGDDGTWRRFMSARYRRVG